MELFFLSLGPAYLSRPLETVCTVYYPDLFAVQQRRCSAVIVRYLRKAQPCATDHTYLFFSRPLAQFGQLTSTPFSAVQQTKGSQVIFRGVFCPDCEILYLKKAQPCVTDHTCTDLPFKATTRPVWQSNKRGDPHTVIVRLDPRKMPHPCT